MALAAGVAVGVWRNDPESQNATSVLPGADGLRVASADLGELVRESSIIIQGTLTSETTREVGLPKADGTIGLTRVDVVRTFSVESVLMGSVDAAGEVEVVATESQDYAAGPALPAFNRSTDAVVPMKVGQTYLLFLARFADVGGQTLLGLASDPGAALVAGSSLEFLASPGLIKEGAAAGAGDLLAGFRGLTQESIAEAIRREGGP
jgi:hypothetical protein